MGIDGEATDTGELMDRASSKKELSTIDNVYLRACVVNLSYSAAIPQ